MVWGGRMTLFVFFNDTATTEIYTLSLHDALPIFLYDSDSYADDLPYYVRAAGRPLLVVPYTLDNNDMKFAVPPGFTANDGFTQHLRDSLDFLRREGRRTRPKMMSVGLHCRLAGRPARAAALERFLDHVARCPDLWVGRRVEMARHWLAAHPAG